MNKQIRWVSILLSILSIVIIIGVSFPSLPTIHAQDTSATITLTEPQLTQVWRKNMVFMVTASSSGADITTARIVISYPGQQNHTSFRIKAFTRAKKVDLKYEWDLRNATTPPWQFFYYYWEVFDANGNKATTENAIAEYVPTTHNWQHLEGHGVTVYWYDRSQAQGQHLLDVAEQGFAIIAKRTGHHPEENLRVVLYKNQQDFSEFYAPFAFKDWIGGQTFGNMTVQWFDEGNEEWAYNQLIPHELAHAFLYEQLQGRVANIPSWFNEGQAMNNEFIGLEEEIAKARTVAMEGRLERIPFMDARNTIGRDDHALVSDWYAQSTSLVRYMYERYGDDVLGKIIQGIQDDLTFEEAFKAATGETLDEYEIAWRAWLGVTEPLPTMLPTMPIVFPPSPTYPPTRTPQP